MSCNSFNRKNAIDATLLCIKNAGLRLTSQRRFLIEGILSFKSPFTADDLYSYQPGSHQVDLATIYRAMSKFVELGILSTVDFNDGIQRYEYSLGNDHHHHHVVCIHCKKVEQITDCNVKAQNKLIEKMGYTQVSHKLEFFGVCQACS